MEQNVHIILFAIPLRGDKEHCFRTAEKGERFLAKLSVLNQTLDKDLAR